MLNQLDTKTSGKEKEVAAFKALQIGNMQSTKIAAKGEFYVLIAHRFGDLTNGLDNFFGLDNAYTKIGGIYGVTDGLSIGLSRQTYNKIYELGLKYRIASQEIDGFPVTIVGYHTMDINSAKKKDNYPGLIFNDRLAYSSQLLISRKFSNSFSLELTPMYIHKNYLDNYAQDRKDIYVLGTGGRYKLTKRLSLNLEYGTRLNAVEHELFHNPLTAGLDIETGGHVFSNGVL